MSALSLLVTLNISYAKYTCQLNEIIRQKVIENKKINKQHITVDNSCILLYTVQQEEDTYEDYNQQFIDGTDL